ncbi:hypothetical protein HJG60_009170 [Phyllostomus discolor]|uniref:Uncharacterized protein n=1 Tax=Phyllostomus discolor TaxID=89673 RepID=A0A833YS30_9CHIR|nr:hypothetical protein HJG60_009170 [Phyllostomus discolor]
MHLLSAWLPGGQETHAMPRGRGAAGLLCPAVLQAVSGLSGAPGVPVPPCPRRVTPGPEAGRLPGLPHWSRLPLSRSWQPGSSLGGVAEALSPRLLPGQPVPWCKVLWPHDCLRKPRLFVPREPSCLALSVPGKARLGAGPPGTLSVCAGPRGAGGHTPPGATALLGLPGVTRALVQTRFGRAGLGTCVSDEVPGGGAGPWAPCIITHSRWFRVSAGAASHIRGVGAGASWPRSS